MTSSADFPSTLILIRRPDRSGLPDVMTPLQHFEQFRADLELVSPAIVLPNVPDPSYGLAAYINCEGFTQTTISTGVDQGSKLATEAANPASRSPMIESLKTPATSVVKLPEDISFSPELYWNDGSGDPIAVSTAFHPTAHPELPPPNTIFSSSDDVLFYVHSSTILNTCSSAFSDFLGGPLEDAYFRNIIIPISSTSREFNVILHLLYGTSSAPHSPNFETLSNAVEMLPHYSIPPEKYIVSGTPLYTLLLSYAPLHPLDLYALAAHHNIRPLAVSTSSHLLSYPLQTITDGQAEHMGAIYLKKLMALHVDRYNALKSILLKPPHPHPPTRTCGFDEQKRLTRAWALVSAYLAWDARPDMSTRSMHAALDPLLGQLDCEGCQQSFQDRIKDLFVQWTAVARTI